MADKDISQATHRLRHAREISQERAADFWQRTILEGRIQRQAGAQMTAGQQREQKPPQPRAS
jgi:hypothetical protein